jgi:hypothetical protein
LGGLGRASPAAALAEEDPMPDHRQSAGDTVPPNCQLIEVRVATLKQLFNGLDPSPFRETDLDTEAEAFIVGWAREVPADAPLGLLVYLGRPAGMPNEAALLGDAVREYFSHRAEASRKRLRHLFRVGRTSLVIGLVCLTGTIAAGDLLSWAPGGSHVAEVIRESLLIGGWVAMWRPLETFLYDWWPLRDEGRLFDRLARMSVRIVYTSDQGPDAWRSDWPVVQAGHSPLSHEPLAYTVEKPETTGSG